MSFLSSSLPFFISVFIVSHFFSLFYFFLLLLREREMLDVEFCNRVSPEKMGLSFRSVLVFFLFLFWLFLSFFFHSVKKKIIVLLCAGENAMIVEKSSAFLFPISRVSLRVSFFFLYCSALLPLTMFGYLRKNLPRNPVKPSKTQ